MIYTLASTGATINLHFCCGKLDSVSIAAPIKDGCDKPDKGISKERCCDNKHLELKLKADQEPVSKWVQVQKALQLPLVKPVVEERILAPTVLIHELPNGPPEQLSSVPIFIKNRVFRI